MGFKEHGRGWEGSILIRPVQEERGDRPRGRGTTAPTLAFLSPWPLSLTAAFLLFRRQDERSDYPAVVGRSALSLTHQVSWQAKMVQHAS